MEAVLSIPAVNDITASTFRHGQRVLPWLSKEAVEGWWILWEFRFSRPVFRKAEKIARSARQDPYWKHPNASV
jgi:hypothetical protein